jgi:hypothetical protein
MNARFFRPRFARWLVPVACVLFVGCGPAEAERDAPQAVSSKPSAETLRLASHPGYAAPSGVRQECLGRLVFDAQRDLEWGLSRPGLWSGDHFRFTEDMHGEEEYVAIGGIKVVVLAPAKWESIEQMQRSTDADLDNGIREYQNDIDTDKQRVERKEAVLKDPSLNANNEDLSGVPAAIERHKNDIAELQARIELMQESWHPIDLGLPQSLGYQAGSALYAFILRDGRAYQFASTYADGDPPLETRMTAFLDFIKRFRPRALYEIPPEPGVCFPYGFVADDGTVHSRTEVSFRFKDRPGVLYTLGALVSGEHGFEGEAAFLKATARAAGSGAGIGRDPQTVGPRQTSIGALPARQGGLSLNVADSGQPALRSYSVYTATDGHPHSSALPAIRLNLRSFTRAQEPTLKSDPPPCQYDLRHLPLTN